MWRGVVAAALLIGCRGEPAPTRRAEPAPVVRSAVPPLPQSPDGAQELVALDLQIEQARTADDREALIAALARRAMLRGRHADLREALAQAQAWISVDKKHPRAWAAWIGITTQAHQFAEADRSFDDLKPLVQDPSEWEPLAATLFEAQGKPDLAHEYRERTATNHPSSTNLTALAANLAMRGRLDDAIALIPAAAAALRDPSPVLVAWLLVQWGRLHVQNGELAAARQLVEEAHRRMPGYVEATVQLATLVRATGGDPGELVTAALVAEPGNPELLALAGQAPQAHAAWQAYLQYPLEEAFADHAARFYLGAGREPARALELASRNFVNRPTTEARSLLVEAQLANALPAEACATSTPLASSTRADQFLAWRAFTVCGQTVEANRLAKTLGIR